MEEGFKNHGETVARRGTIVVVAAAAAFDVAVAFVAAASVAVAAARAVKDDAFFRHEMK